MSRILRRPMFRGGRVDSRGTGITSNLGYAGGGSVNTPRRGLVTRPGGYAGIPKYKTGAEIMEEVRTKPWLTTSHLRSNLPVETTEETVDVNTQINTTDKKIPKKAHRTGEIRMVDNPNYIAPTKTAYVGRYKTPTQVELTEYEIAFNTEGDHPGQAELWRDPADTSGTGNGDGGAGTPEKTDAEKLAEYQEMFEKAYGSGRGDDISNMLLSFAGKALKPEATTKTAFGEFFEEEAKRPSESKKYKDAATTAAINAFLTGEKDFNAFMNQMKIMERGVDYKTAAEAEKQKNYTINDYVIADKGGSTTSAIKKGARKVIEARGLGTKGLQILDEKDANDPKLLDPQNVGEVFMDEDNNIVFQLILKDGVIIKDFLYR